MFSSFLSGFHIICCVPISIVSTGLLLHKAGVEPGCRAPFFCSHGAVAGLYPGQRLQEFCWEGANGMTLCLDVYPGPRVGQDRFKTLHDSPLPIWINGPVPSHASSVGTTLRSLLAFSQNSPSVGCLDRARNCLSPTPISVTRLSAPLSFFLFKHSLYTVSTQGLPTGSPRLRSQRGVLGQRAPKGKSRRHTKVQKSSQELCQ